MAKVPAPPRFSRALYVAAFAVAASALAPLRPTGQRATPARIERRDRTIRQIARFLGQAFIAAGRAGAAFRQTATFWTPALPAVAVDPRVAAVIDCEPFAALIGRARPEEDPEAPWVEFKPEPPRVSIYWRGTIIPGDRRANGSSEDSARQLSQDDFARAVAAAARALNEAGYRTSGLLEVRELRIGAKSAPGAGFSFEGLVATIGLVRQREAASHERLTIPAG